MAWFWFVLAIYYRSYALKCIKWDYVPMSIYVLKKKSKKKNPSGLFWPEWILNKVKCFKKLTFLEGLFVIMEII